MFVLEGSLKKEEFLSTSIDLNVVVNNTDPYNTTSAGQEPKREKLLLTSKCAGKFSFHQSYVFILTLCIVTTCTEPSTVDKLCIFIPVLYLGIGVVSGVAFVFAIGVFIYMARRYVKYIY